MRREAIEELHRAYDLHTKGDLTANNQSIVDDHVLRAAVAELAPPEEANP